MIEVTHRVRIGEKMAEQHFATQAKLARMRKRNWLETLILGREPAPDPSGLRIDVTFTVHTQEEYWRVMHFLKGDVPTKLCVLEEAGL